MNDANYEALRSAFETIVAHIKSIDTRLTNTIENAPAILENLNDRMQKLEDKYDQLNGASDDRLDEYVNNSDALDSLIEAKVDNALENYDPSDHLDISEAVRDAITESYWFEDTLKDAVRELNFTVEVR